MSSTTEGWWFVELGRCPSVELEDAVAERRVRRGCPASSSTREGVVCGDDCVSSYCSLVLLAGG